MSESDYIDEVEYRMEIDHYGNFRRRGPDPKWVNPSRTREKFSYPYSYDEFFIFGSRETIKKTDGADYSDRLWEWWVEKKTSESYDALWKKHIGRRYDQASADQLGAFLTEYNQTLFPKENAGKTFKVVALAEGCNPSNGYPYWIVWYRKSASATR